MNLANVRRLKILHKPVEGICSLGLLLHRQRCCLFKKGKPSKDLEREKDAVIAAGVLPDIVHDRLTLKDKAMLIRDGGRLFVEFRNGLFLIATPMNS